MIVLGAELGSPSFRGLVALCLNFPKRPSRLKRSSITLDIVKNLRRSQTTTIQKQDNNSPNVY
jgi:hypothetical protein